MPLLTFFMGPLGRKLAMALVFAAMMAGSFYKGYSFAQERESAKHAQEMAIVIEKAKVQANLDSKAAAQAANERNAMAKKSEDLKKQLEELKKKNPSLATCRAGEDIKKNLNEGFK